MTPLSAILSLTNDLSDLTKPIPKKDHLLSYLAWSNTPGFDHKKAYGDMFDRSEVGHSTPGLNFRPQEATIFDKRYKAIRSNNKVYRLASKVNPTVQDIEEFSYIDPCYSLLWPVKLFLIDHPLIAKEYRGCLPFGRLVVAYFNTYRDTKIKGTPDYKSHILLMNWTNQMSNLMGIPSVTVNSLMYLEGKELVNGSENDSVE